MSAFEYPIASEALLTKLIEKVIYKSYLNLHVTVNTFRWAGKPSELRYLLYNYQKIPNYRSDRLFLVLDFQSYDDIGSIYKSSLTLLSTQFGFLLSDAKRDTLNSLTAKEVLGQSAYLEFLKALLTEDFNLTLIIENFKFTHDGSANASLYVDLIDTIKKINTDKISFIFMNDREFDARSKDSLQKIWQYVTFNQVWGLDLLFDNDSILQSITNHEQKYSINFSDLLKKKLAALTFGDPTTLKRALMLCINDANVLKQFEESVDPASIFDLLGQDWADERYKDILFNISDSSLNALIANDYKNLSEFVLKTGLVLDKDDTKVLLNPLLDVFITLNKSTLVEAQRNSIRTTPNDYLSGQELIVFKHLIENTNSIISKDIVAELIWGPAWESKYSDWAIDKLVSNLRKKLQDNNYKKTIKSFKGKGIQLL